MKAVKKSASVLLALVLLLGVFGTTFFVWGSTDVITDRAKLGNFTHYNGILFDYFEGLRADTEGALAIGGDSKYGSTGYGYDVGAGLYGSYATQQIGNYKNPKGYPSLLSGGMPRVATNNWVGVYGGPLVLDETHKSGYQNSSPKLNGTTQYAKHSVVEEFFADAYDTFTKLARTLNDANLQKGSFIKLNSMNTWGSGLKTSSAFLPDNLESTGGQAVAVINFTDGANITFDWSTGINLSADFLQYDVIVLNFPNAVNINFNGGSFLRDGYNLNTSAPALVWPDQNAALAAFASRVVWNFPAAQSIKIGTYGVVGSVNAPYAYVEGTGGSLNGMLVADSLKAGGGFELHAFTMNQYLPDFKNEDEIATGSARLYKVTDAYDINNSTQKEGLEYLEDAGFALYYRASGQGSYSLYGSYTTNLYGEIFVDDLPEGDYYFIETKAPEGYIKDGSTKYSFTISDADAVDGVVPTFVFYAKNSRIVLNGVTLKKVDADESNAGIIGGVDEFLFYLYRSHPTGSGKLDLELLEALRLDTDTATITLNGLYEGFYYLLEVETPQAYSGNEGTVYQLEVAPISSSNPALQLKQLNLLHVDIGGIDISNPVGLENDQGVLKTDLLTSGSLHYLPNSKDPEKTGSLLVIKTNKDRTAALSGAVFELYQIAEGRQVPYGQYTTGAFGVIEVEDLPFGEYLLKEIKAPAGYQLAGNSWPFTIGDTAGEELHYTAVVENSPLETSVELIKQDADTNQPLAGAVFAVYKSRKQADGTLNLHWQRDVAAGSGGSIQLDGLTEGSYYLRETEVPEGYILPQDVVYQVKVTLNSKGLPEATVYRIRLDLTHFELDKLTRVDATQGILEYEQLQSPYLIENRRENRTPGRVAVHKEDGQTGDVLEGAVFGLYPVVGGVRGELFTQKTTDNTGTAVFESLPLGTYELVEIQPPAGYEATLRAETFTIAYGDEGYTHRYTYQNTQRTTGFTFTKVAQADGRGLEGARFLLYKSYKLSDGNLGFHFEEVVTSGQEGRVELAGLTLGHYYLMEMQAPAGYVVDNRYIYQISVTLDETGEFVKTMYRLHVSHAGIDLNRLAHDNSEVTRDDWNHAVVENPALDGGKEETGSISLQKTDPDGNVLQGAEFTLYISGVGEEDGGYIWDAYEHTPLTTDARGMLEVDGLVLGYHYKLEETKAPDGYDITITDFGPFQLTEQSPHMHITAVNTPQPPAQTPAQLAKVNADDTSEGLAGARFVLYSSFTRADGTRSLHYEDEFVAGANGIVSLGSLQSGYYYLVETQPPEGYVLNAVPLLLYVDAENDPPIADLYELEIKLEDMAGYNTLAELLQAVEEGTITRRALAGNRVENNPEPEKTGRLVVTKVDGDDATHLLAGAEFVLKNDNDGKEYPFITDQFGYGVVEELPLGSYTLTETAPPEGYELAGTPIPVTIADTGAALVVEYLTVENYKPSETVDLIKTGESNAPLPGAIFNLYQSSKNGNLLDFTLIEANIISQNDGSIPIPPLEKGTYYLVEVTPPEGYYLEHTYKVIQMYINPGSAKPVIVYELDLPDAGLYDLNNLTGIEDLPDTEKTEIVKNNGVYAVANAKKPPVYGQVVLRKTDEAGGHMLPGAEYRLHSKDANTLIGTYVTNSMGVIKVGNLAPGRYYFVESKAPAGYALDTAEHHFTIGDGQNNPLNVSVYVRNKPVLSQIQVYKGNFDEFESGSQTWLTDTVFALYRWSSEPIFDGDTFIARGPRSGASAAMALESPAHATLVGLGTTDDAGKYEFTNLEHGWYTIYEVVPPDGFDSAIENFENLGGKEIELVISERTAKFEITGVMNPGNEYEFLFAAYNSRIRSGDIQLAKRDGDEGQLLANVQFKLQGYNAKTRDFEDLTNIPPENLVTGAGGTITIAGGLHMGLYRLVEVENRNDGYVTDPENPETIMFRITDGDNAQQIQLGTVYNFRGITAGLRLQKQDSVTGAGLEGAVFNLQRLATGVNAAGEEYTYWQGVSGLGAVPTDANGRLELTGLAPGEYWLTETSPPDGYYRLDADGNAVLPWVRFTVEADANITMGEASDSSIFSYSGGLLTVLNSAYTQGGIQFVKVDGDTGQGLAGASFALEYSITGEAGSYAAYGFVASGENGVMQLPLLLQGYYRLQETAAPGGYQISDTVYSFEVWMRPGGTWYAIYDGTRYEDGAQTTPVLVANTRTAATPGPETGGGQTGDDAALPAYLLAAIAALCGLTAILVLRLRRRDKRRR